MVKEFMSTNFNNNPACNDLLLVPKLGKLLSRSEAKLHPFIYSAPMDRVTGYWLAKAMLEVGEIPVISRFLSEEERRRCLKEFHSTPAFFAVGATKEHLKIFIDDCAASLPEGAELNVAIDIAHGHSVSGKYAAEFIRVELPFIKGLMSGSIATAVAAEDCCLWGYTHLRVGIGGGSACTTRLMTGVGVPTITSIHLISCRLGLRPELKRNVSLIADGGIKTPGDAVKCLAAGASGIMMGREFSKAFESPGWELQQYVDNSNLLICGPMADRMPKVYTETYRGQASAEFQIDQKGEASWCPEGASTSEMSWGGDTVKSIVMKYRGGVSSALSYLGLESLSQLKPYNVEFIQITHAGQIESLDHANLK